MVYAWCTGCATGVLVVSSGDIPEVSGIVVGGTVVEMGAVEVADIKEMAGIINYR